MWQGGLGPAHFLPRPKGEEESDDNRESRPTKSSKLLVVLGLMSCPRLIHNAIRSMLSARKYTGRAQPRLTIAWRQRLLFSSAWRAL